EKESLRKFATAYMNYAELDGGFELNKSILSLLDENAALLAMLEKLEYSNQIDDGFGHCPLCGHRDGDFHNKSCELGLLLAKIKESKK
ncbi:MAG TPA: hypothetical protein VIJ25_05400, partial [Methylococcales bacterium]